MKLKELACISVIIAELKLLRKKCLVKDRADIETRINNLTNYLEVCHDTSRHEVRSSSILY
jgi:hypothetical protein